MFLHAYCTIIKKDVLLHLQQRGEFFIKFFNLLSNVPLFSGITEDELQRMFGCLGAAFKTYGKGAAIFLAGEPVPSFGVMLNGVADIVREDITGARAIIAKVCEGELFGEAFACGEVDESPVSVFAAAECEVLLLPVKGILSVCPHACAFHARLVENMMRLLARKNILLHEKMELLSKKTIRERLLAYLYLVAQRQGSRRFAIPFTRGELADYLCTDRSALSRELSAMQSEGLLTFNRNEFHLSG